MSGCSNSYKNQVILYHKIDKEAKANLNAIFTDETAFNATNSMFISAGYHSTEGLNLSTNTLPHKFYIHKITPTSKGPYKCNSNILRNSKGKNVKSGFLNLGFSPFGYLYFYYFVKVLPTASTSMPQTLSVPPLPSLQPVVQCGAGFEAFAVTNLNGNIRVYAVNDFSSNPILVYGKSYRKAYQKLRQQKSLQDYDQDYDQDKQTHFVAPPPPPKKYDLY